MSSSASDDYGYLPLDMSQRVFFLFLGVVIAGSGAFMVYDSIQGRPLWQIMFGLFFILIGCLMIFAGISKRTKSSREAGDGNI